ncbi:MAG: DUF998 domain-containing protein [Saprospiraceae bacterium]|nr:DUF998 domain-containing protein [Saprospiraceae bacterium]
MTKKRHQSLALGGIAGPVIFTIVIIIGAALRSDYNHLHNFISELGATGTSNAWLMNYVGFLASGILITLFGIALISSLPKKAMTMTGSILILLFGVGMFFDSFFSCDPGCPPNGSQEALMHDGISFFMFLFAIIGTILLGLSFRKLPLWKGFSTYSIVTGIVALIFLILMIYSMDSRVLTGLWQRLHLLTVFLWMVLIGLHIYNLPDSA